MAETREEQIEAELLQIAGAIARHEKVNFTKAARRLARAAIAAMLEE